MDASGYVRIVGRIKDMIIRGGENIYPREVEEFLYQHPQFLRFRCLHPRRKDGRGGLCLDPTQRGRRPYCDDVKAYCKDQIPL